VFPYPDTETQKRLLNIYIFCFCNFSDPTTAASQLPALPEAGDPLTKPDTSNQTLTKTENLNLTHEGENAVVSKVPDSGLLVNKPLLEPAARSKENTQSAHTRGQINVSEGNMHNLPVNEAFNTLDQESQNAEELKPENTSAQDLTILPETDCHADSTSDNDVQTTTPQKPDTSNQTLTKTENLNLTHEGENAVVSKVPDSGLLVNKPLLEPAARSKENTQSAHTRGQINVSEGNMHNLPVNEAFNTLDQESQNAEELKPENTSVQDLTTLPETDCHADSTSDNDVQITTPQKTDSKPIHKSGFSDRTEVDIKEKPGMIPEQNAENTQIKTSVKISVGDNDNALNTNIDELDGTAETTDQNKGDQDVSTKEQTKPEEILPIEAEGDLGQEHDEEASNPQTETANSTNVQDRTAIHSMHTEKLQGSAKRDSDKKYKTKDDVAVHSNVDIGVAKPLDRTSSFPTEDDKQKSTQTPATKSIKVYTTFTSLIWKQLNS